MTLNESIEFNQNNDDYQEDNIIEIKTVETIIPHSLSNGTFSNSISSSFDNLEHTHIGISGLIGAGKSTLCTALGQILNLPCYYEPVIDNEYLADFYEDQKKYSFQLQVYLLNKRFKQQQSLIWSNKGGIQDRTIYEDCVFATMLKNSGLMEERDFRTYLELFRNMSNFMKKPNLIIHLDVTPEESLERIKNRNRDCESNIPLSYLRDLYEAYEVFLKDISKIIPIIKVNWKQFRTAEEMAVVIKKEYEKLCNIRYVDFDNNNNYFSSHSSDDE
eukprot:TRINITY_DN549_c1_g1_i1.p1 TRINITY_DN549_c1_g1~~TRINITY_DN549_c1_g1_i1.p1  ORF type:complete len:274 (+),score=78.74 TRINITY_DN549_c1_g1_i1:92-913(+)